MITSRRSDSDMPDVAPVLRPALEAAGFRVEHSEGGLYLWATRGEAGRASVDFLAGLGILVAPGDFYGSAAGAFVRIALTATDERIAAAADRLSGEVNHLPESVVIREMVDLDGTGSIGSRLPDRPPEGSWVTPGRLAEPPGSKTRWPASAPSN